VATSPGLAIPGPAALAHPTPATAAPASPAYAPPEISAYAAPAAPAYPTPAHAIGAHAIGAHATSAPAPSPAAVGPPVPMAGLTGLRQVAPDRPPAVLPTRSVYRSVLAPLPPAPARPVERGAVLTRGVPGDIASMFRSMHGIDVSDVPVHRGRVVTEHARDLGARAFTSGQEIYLPDAVGSLDAPQARALLAHELTHAAHQRRLGAALPDESSAAGQVLEAQAVATERWFLGGQGQDLPVPSLAAAPGSAAGSRAAGSTAPGSTAPWSLAPPRPRLADDRPPPALRSRPFPSLQHVQRQPIWAPSGGATASSAATVADLAASGAATLMSLAREHATWSAPAWLGGSGATTPRNTAARNTAPGNTAPGNTAPGHSMFGRAGGVAGAAQRPDRPAAGRAGRPDRTRRARHAAVPAAAEQAAARADRRPGAGRPAERL
jgi:Domain of unknown function (DUF4157)